MDIALCSLSMKEFDDPSSEFINIKYAGANNPLWIIKKDENKVLEIKGDKQPIGRYAKKTSFTTHTIKLQKGDAIYLFSDGYPDQFGGDKGKKFKSINFKKLLLGIKDLTMQEQKIALDEAFEKWKGDLEQVDDVCVIGVRL